MALETAPNQARDLHWSASMRRTLLTLIAGGLITATTPSCISSQASRGTAIAVGVGATLLGAAVYGAASDTDRCTDECRPDVGGILLGVGLMALGGGTAALNGLMYLSDPPAHDKAAPAKATATASLGDTSGGLQVLPPSAFVLDER